MNTPNPNPSPESNCARRYDADQIEHQLACAALTARKCPACDGTKVVSEGGHDTGCDACHLSPQTLPAPGEVERQVLLDLQDLVALEPMHPDGDGWSDWVHPLPGYRMGCCDCGLVHDMQFKIVPHTQGGALNPGETSAGVVIFRAKRSDP